MISIKKEKKVIKINIFYFVLSLILMLIFDFIIYTVSGIGLLSFLGFSYKSHISAFLFFLISYILFLPFNYYKPILIGLFKDKSKISPFQQRLIDFILYCSFSSLIIGFIDFNMKTIHISSTNQVLFIILYYLFEMYSDQFMFNKN